MNIIGTLSVADRLVLALGGLYRAVAARVGRGRFGEAPLAEALIWLVCQRIRRVEGRILGMLARFRAGTLRVGGAGRAGVGGVRAAGGGSGAEVRLPRGFAWLLPMVPCEAANYASQLRGVLAEPEMVGLLAASPQARLVLGPVCRMLGIEAEVLTAGVAEQLVSEPVAVVKVRVRTPRAKVDWGRVPLPRGVLSAARREGFGKV